VLLRGLVRIVSETFSKGQPVLVPSDKDPSFVPFIELQDKKINFSLPHWILHFTITRHRSGRVQLKRNQLRSELSRKCINGIDYSCYSNFFVLLGTEYLLNFLIKCISWDFGCCCPCPNHILFIIPLTQSSKTYIALKLS